MGSPTGMPYFSAKYVGGIWYLSAMAVSMLSCCSGGCQPENGLHVLLGGSHALLHHRGEFRFGGDLCLIGGVEPVELRMELRGDVRDVLQRDGEVCEGCQIESSFSLRLCVSDGFPEFLDACGGLDDLVLPVNLEIDFENYVFGHDEI